MENSPEDPYAPPKAPLERELPPPPEPIYKKVALDHQWTFLQRYDQFLERDGAELHEAVKLLEAEGIRTVVEPDRAAVFGDHELLNLHVPAAEFERARDLMRERFGEPDHDTVAQLHRRFKKLVLMWVLLFVAGVLLFGLLVELVT